ncbi:hypothetical protein [Microcoleus sp. FACHB-672]|nr:hypothetical protein [Microcoleus sp. FACHB-672]
MCNQLLVFCNASFQVKRQSIGVTVPVDCLAAGRIWQAQKIYLRQNADA